MQRVTNGRRRIRALALGGAIGLAAAAPAWAQDRAPAAACRADLAVAWPVAGARIDRAALVPSGTAKAITGPVAVPAHCELFGTMGAHRGIDGQDYAIRFHLRLPAQWNRRFLFQGGGGTNGWVGDALGATSLAAPPALALGYAVLSQDSGHDIQANGNPARGGATAFGFDPQARADYGHASLAPVTRAARAIIAAYYGKAPAFSYFVGCSKGGEEGMVLAQQHPDLFNGIVAAAPGFALPRAAVSQVWDVQAMAGAAPAGLSGWRRLNRAFDDRTLSLVGQAVLAACDGADGLVDGMVMGRCDDARVWRELRRRACPQPAASACLAPAQLAALKRVMAGARDTAGRAIYADWPWDPGIAAPGWRMWKLGNADATIPAMNVTLGGASLPSVFSVPPIAVPADPDRLFAWEMAFDVARDARRIYATNQTFPRSAWQDVSARSDDLSAFRARGGKLIVPQGAADPVFSLNDTLAWYKAVNRREGGRAANFARVFPVPGMNHCGGGPATDLFDAFAAVVAWVEQGRAPDMILAKAGPATPWPGRSRPLCPFPKAAHYVGGDKEQASSFTCS